ncbi:RNA polymerase sigma factor [Euzebya tangerina]|uniref:RNA polymerase sigma factor n=1 Tax=Euzebya tangerina TaxID=591198 RepID=UPI0013C32C5E|nr:sigma-70 family RNA polymerase sigma factor [Euzebya tangerina]
MDHSTAFASGDPDAVRAVVRQYSRPIQTVARSIVGGDNELVADVVQQTFVKAWKNASSFDPGRDLAPWLYAIARRTAIDALRSERRPTQGGHDPETDLAVDPPSFERTWNTFQLRQALDRLPDDEREAVRLTHLEGLTQPEAAERLGVPVGTVKSRSHRAMTRLRTALAHLEDPATSVNRSGTRRV